MIRFILLGHSLCIPIYLHTEWDSFALHLCVSSVCIALTAQTPLHLAYFPSSCSVL